MKKEYYDKMINALKLKPTNPELTTNHKQEIECLLCGHIFSATTKGKVANFKKHKLQGCKKCTDRVQHSTTRREHIKKVETKFDILVALADDQFIPKDTKILVENKECGHQFAARWDNLKNELTNCPICNTKEKIKRCKINSKNLHKNALAGKTEFEIYRSKVSSVTRKTYKIYESDINPLGLKRVLAGGVGYHLDHKISVRNCFLWGVPPEICGSRDNLEMVKWRDNLSKKVRSTLDIPKDIIPYIGDISKIFYEEMDDYLSKLKTAIKVEKYKKVGPYMVSYMLRDDFAVVFLPFTMFKQQSLLSTSYLKKFKKFLISKNIDSYFIYEDEWFQKNQIVKSKLLYKLGETPVKLHARKCQIREVNNTDKNVFLNEHHLQGTCISNISIGAYFDDVLVSVMTFSLPRKQMGTKNNIDGRYELSRFCTKTGVTIAGVASRLFKYFVKKHKPTSIFSFSDLRWSERSGSVYEKMGFTVESVVNPDYKYVVDGHRKHRWGFRKSLIKQRFPHVWDSTKTEYDMMLKNGIDRVWDCGYIKYSIDAITT